MDATLKLKAEQLAGDIAAQAQTLEDLNGLLRTLMKSALERMLDTEMDVHLGRKTIAALPAVDVERGDQAAAANRRNGHSKKTVRGDMGELALDTPRDRNGTFEPHWIAKHQRRLAGFDEKILALYAKGMEPKKAQANCFFATSRLQASQGSEPCQIGSPDNMGSSSRRLRCPTRLWNRYWWS
jgi:putative transposase